MYKKDLVFLVFCVLLISLVFRGSFSNFFAQDDFILINYFSSFDLATDLKHVFGYPVVSHWRPIFNLYFLICGKLFGKNLLGYHLVTLLVQAMSTLGIFKILRKFEINIQSAAASALIYGISPAHFLTIYWISGNATAIGFMFFVFSFYFFLSNSKTLSASFYFLSLLSSEAMLAGFLVIASYSYIFNKTKYYGKLLLTLFLMCLIFLPIRLLFLTSKSTFDAYRFEISLKFLSSIKYYLLRTFGFAESSNGIIVKLLLLIFLFCLSLVLVKNLKLRDDVRRVIWGLGVVVIGLFPFILIPSHLAPNYMNLSIFGFVILISSALLNRPILVIWTTLTCFAIISILAVNLTSQNNWVVKRSFLAKNVIGTIKNARLNRNSMIIFKDFKGADSKEMYISLGTGTAILMFFPDNNYKTCFEFIGNCDQVTGNAYILKSP